MLVLAAAKATLSRMRLEPTLFWTWSWHRPTRKDAISAKGTLVAMGSTLLAAAATAVSLVTSEPGPSFCRLKSRHRAHRRPQMDESLATIVATLLAAVATTGM